MFTPRAPRAIVRGGILCGTLYLAASFVDAKLTFHMSPVRLLQSFAGILMGPGADESGWPTAVLGLAMHFAVAFLLAAIFHLLARRFPGLIRWPGAGGIIYGALVFLIMYRLALPLTIELKSHYVPFYNRVWPELRWSQFFIHVVCVGLPLDLVVRSEDAGC